MKQNTKLSKNFLIEVVSLFINIISLPFDKDIVDMIASYGYLYFDDLIIAGYNDIRYLYYINSLPEHPVEIYDSESDNMWSIASGYLDDNLYSNPEYQYHVSNLIFKLQGFTISFR